MFTGIVEEVGILSRVRRESDLVELHVEAPGIQPGVRVGDSIAVNGSCLTVTQVEEDGFRFEAMLETLERTSLGGFREGARLNLERAMRADGRLDGHIVQGHVDGTGEVERLEREGEDVRLYVRCGDEIAQDLVDKGSVTIDGVSLTVVKAGETGFDVALIPHTLAVTTLGELRPGDRVNLEVDVLGKYVRRYLERLMPGGTARGEDAG